MREDRAGRRLRDARRPAAATRLVTAAGATLLSGCSPALLDPAGPVAAQQGVMLVDAVVVMLCIVVPVIVLAITFAWWFRAGNRHATRRPGFVFSGKVELVVWSVPLLTILFLGSMAWIGSHRLDPARPLDGRAAPLTVQVVSLDWKWLFIYPEQGIASVDRLVIPAGRPVRFELTSGSVMTAFFVPRLGSMIYTMNGMQTTLHLQADRPGRYQGRASHFSGDGFSDMAFAVDAATPQAFADWVAATRSRGGTLDGARYAALARPGRTSPVTYASVSPDLFHRIVDQTIPPAPGKRARRNS